MFRQNNLQILTYLQNVLFLQEITFNDFASFVGRKPHLKSLFLLFESARSSAFWPVARSERPQDSFADFHKILMNNFFFIVTARMDINQCLYSLATPKFPLTITKTLDFVGSSSKNLTSVLEVAGIDAPLATCSVQTVLVDPNTRRPTPFPDWWREKYLSAVEEKTPFKMKSLVRPDNSLLFPHTVYFGDTDSYRHTNWVSYVRFCYDACMDGMWRERYGRMRLSEAEKGVKSFEITFKKESSVGDRLVIYSWENEEPNGLSFEIMKENDLCCQANISFHTKPLPD